jgi:hypothetical protein
MWLKKRVSPTKVKENPKTPLRTTWYMTTELLARRLFAILMLLPVVVLAVTMFAYIQARVRRF